MEYNAQHFIPTETRKEIQDVVLEYGLFHHIIKIKRTNFVNTTDIIKVKQRKRVYIVNTYKVVEVDGTKSPTFKFDVQTSRSKKWFVLEDDWLKTDFTTIERDFYEEFYIPNAFVKERQKDKMFPITIDNAKVSNMNVFDPHAPEIKYEKIMITPMFLVVWTHHCFL